MNVRVRRLPRRSVLVVLLAGTIVGVGSIPASAHCSLGPFDAAIGSPTACGPARSSTAGRSTISRVPYALTLRVDEVLSGKDPGRRRRSWPSRARSSTASRPRRSPTTWASPGLRDRRRLRGVLLRRDLPARGRPGRGGEGGPGRPRPFPSCRPRRRSRSARAPRLQPPYRRTADPRRLRSWWGPGSCSAWGSGCSSVSGREHPAPSPRKARLPRSDRRRRPSNAARARPGR